MVIVEVVHDGSLLIACDGFCKRKKKGEREKIETKEVINYIILSS